jgi:flagellar protein FlaI
MKRRNRLLPDPEFFQNRALWKRTPEPSLAANAQRSRNHTLSIGEKTSKRRGFWGRNAGEKTAKPHCVQSKNRKFGTINNLSSVLSNGKKMPDYFESLLEKAKKKQREEGLFSRQEKPGKTEAVPATKKLEQALEQKMPSEKAMTKKLEDLRMPTQRQGDRIHWVLENKKTESRKESSPFEKLKKTIVAQYNETTIYKVEGSHLLHYEVPVPKPSTAEKAVINAVKEAATRLISISPYKIRDPQQKRNVYYQRIIEILQNNPELSIPPNRYEFYANAVVREMVGYGIIDSLINDDLLEEIMVIGPRKPVYVFHREFEMMTTNIEFYNDEEIQDLVNRIAREVGRRVDISSPLLDARLPDGSRVNATIPPASVDDSSLTIRKFRKDPYSLIDLVQLKTINLETAAFLWLCVEGMGTKPANILISGGTGSGKTTTLNALAALIPERERIVTIEDTAELALPLEHWIRLEARPPGLEGTGELTMDILTKNALRMRPDRIIVGEVRHAEAFTLFTALNTGHDGMASQDSLIQLSDGSIQKLGGFCEKYFDRLPTKKMNDIEYVELESEKPEIVAVNKQNLSQESAKVKTIWKRPCQKSRAIKLASGKTIKLSFDHPVFRLKNGFVEQIQSKDCKKGDYLCSINAMNIGGKRFDADYAYFLGSLLGDGHLRPDGMFFENKNKQLQKTFQRLTKKLFNKKARLHVRKNGKTTSSLFSVQIAGNIHRNFKVPFGNKTKIFDIPPQIETADNRTIGSFLRGLFDTDGHASDVRKSVCLSTSNQTVVQKAPLLLKRFGIESRISCQKKDGKGHKGPYYRIFITGEPNLREFQKSVGFEHPVKTRKLASIVGVKENTNVDVVPGTGALIRRIRTILGFSHRALAVKAGHGLTGSTINSYENDQRNPARKTLQQLNQTFITAFNQKTRALNRFQPSSIEEKIEKSPNKAAIGYAFQIAKQFSSIEQLQQKSRLKNKLLYYYRKKQGALFDRKRLASAANEIIREKQEELAQTRPLLTHINAITNQTVRWEKVISIDEKDEKTHYYDLTLDQFNTFVANGIIVSNCLGTLHANTPEETIVRVTNPPMNVPSTMLAALDLILVENRLHDKQRGTIRRITEIAEVVGALEGEPSTKNILVWNPVTDSLERTANEIDYIKKIQKFTGLEPKQIELEWKRRERILQTILQKNIRNIQAVRSETNRFLENK